MISNINVQILRIGLRLRNSEGRIKAVRKQWTSEKEEEQRMVSSIITCQVTVQLPLKHLSKQEGGIAFIKEPSKGTLSFFLLFLCYFIRSSVVTNNSSSLKKQALEYIISCLLPHCFKREGLYGRSVYPLVLINA